MRFHVVALPHTQTNKSHSACAFTMKVLHFCQMMAASATRSSTTGPRGARSRVLRRRRAYPLQAEQEGFFGKYDGNAF